MGSPLAISRRSGRKLTVEPSLLRRRLVAERRSAISSTKIEVSMVWLRSPGTARKLLHVLDEGLRRQLQPLHHGQVGEQLVGEFLHRHPGPNGDGGSLDDLARFRGHRLNAQYPAGARFVDHLDET